MVLGEAWIGDGERGGRRVERFLRAFVLVDFPLVFEAVSDFLLRTLDCRFSRCDFSGDELLCGGAKVSLLLVRDAFFVLLVGIVGRGGFGRGSSSKISKMLLDRDGTGDEDRSGGVGGCEDRT